MIQDLYLKARELDTRVANAITRESQSFLRREYFKLKLEIARLEQDSYNMKYYEYVLQNHPMHTRINYWQHNEYVNAVK